MNIKNAIFDMDGTLVDSLMIWEVFWVKIGEKYLGKKDFVPSEEIDKSVRTMTLRDAIELIRERYSIRESGDEILEFVNEMLRSFYSETVLLKDGVREFLENCRKNGVKMCIASATAPDLVELALKHCEIKDYFLKLFSCGAIGVGKEKPDVFLLAQESLGSDIEDTWVFEDSLVAIETAKKAGFKTVGIYDRYNYGADRIKEIADEYIAPGETLMRLFD